MQLSKGTSFFAGLVIVLTLTSLPSEVRADSGTLKIGVVKSVFRDLPSSWINVITQPLRALMVAETGLKGDIVLVEDADALAAGLQNGKLDIGIAHGIELAWARIKNPKVKPLVIAARKKSSLCACLVVHKDAVCKCCEDLKGKKLAIPRRSRLPSHLYLQRRCPNATTKPEKFFSQISQPSTPTSALDAVVRKKVSAAIVDHLDIDTYREGSLSYFQKLRVLQQSGLFPAGVVVYQPGKLEEGTVQSLLRGLKNASKTARGKSLLNMCRIGSFEDVPADYEDQLKSIVEAYPPTIQEPIRKKEEPKPVEASSQKKVEQETVKPATGNKEGSK